MNTNIPNDDSTEQSLVPLSGYFALLFAILIFSGIFASSKGWITVFDFSALNGKFGTMKDAAKNSFVGSGGSGAKAGFTFALSLVPGVMLALGIMEVVEHLGGLKAAQRLLSPILRPLLGIPGISGVALISSLQSTDAGAGMTRALYENGQITEKERLIFAAFQFTAGGTVTNYLSSGSALFAFLTIPTMWPLVILFVMKIFSANVLRFYLTINSKRGISQ